MGQRIDAHQHFWRYDPMALPWISDAMPQLRRDFLPSDLAPLLAANGFDGCIAVQAQQNVAETEWLLQLAEAQPFIRGVVGWLNLRAPDVSADLGHFAAHPHFRGVRHIVQDEPDDQFMLRADFQRGIAQLRRFDLTYDILIYARQLPAAIELVRRFPEQRFILEHLGKPAMRDGRFEEWRRAITALATFDNVACKLSGMVTEAGRHTWQAADFTSYLDTALESFGAERLMIGSDWPVCTLVGSYERVVNVVREYIAHLSATEQAAILGENAVRIYGLI